MFWTRMQEWNLYKVRNSETNSRVYQEIKKKRVYQDEHGQI